MTPPPASPNGDRAAASLRPPRLHAGSTVAVVATSGCGEPDLLAEGCRVLDGWGLHVQVGTHTLERHPVFDYLAAPDEDRAADLQEAWLDPQVEAVLAARGGYGAQRIVDRLDWAAMAAVPPKIFTGFSDITALHEAFAGRLGLATLHAPNIWGTGFSQHSAAQRALRSALFEPDAPDVQALPFSAVQALAHGRATGRTAGGNLSMIASGLGTADGRQDGGFAGCILLLEDVGEEPYRLDRVLTQLLRAGALDGVAAVALGTWAGCEPERAVRAVMADRLIPLGVPVAWGLQFGHVAPQPVIPLGVPATIDTQAGTLTFHEPAVS
ncbi:MAG TPA: LD-carboxypeptidase [Streptosporangiaceae bacterium]|jgi:muramoyltetrapeptide carboxypeptidase